MKKKFWNRKKNFDGLLPILWTGRSTGCAGKGAGRAGAGALGWALGAGLGVQARRQQAWQQALGRAGTARACADGRGARGRASRTRRARQPRHGRAGARGLALARGAGERAAGRGRSARQAGAWARLVHWLGQFGALIASLGFDLGF